MKKKRAEELISFRPSLFQIELELQLQGKLNLPRRALVTVREAGGLDLAESAAGSCQSGIPKAGMVEDIEEFGPELQVEPLGDLGVLDDREVGVYEVRAGESVAAETTRMATSSDHGIGFASRRRWRRAEGARNRESSIGSCRAVGNRRRSSLQRTVE